MYRTTQNLQKDNELADFADRLLNDGMEQDASSSNVELISLEKTILNLKETFPPKKLDEDKARRMLAQVKLRARQEKNRSNNLSFSVFLIFNPIHRLVCWRQLRQWLF